MTTTQDHLTTLRQAANANLAALASGQVKAEQARKAAARKAQKALDQEQAKATRQAFKADLIQLKRLEQELEELDHLMENIGEVAIPGQEMGALEEVDFRRDQVVEKMGRLRRYWQL